MGYLQKAMVALAAVLCLVCSSVFVGVVVHLIKNPPEIEFTMRSEDCVRWEALGCTWEIGIREGELERLIIRPWPLLRSLI